jgi:hypothetical protein
VSGYFHTLAALSWGNNPRYQLPKSLCGHNRESGCFGEQINFLVLPEIKPRFLVFPPAFSLLCRQHYSNRSDVAFFCFVFFSLRNVNFCKCVTFNHKVNVAVEKDGEDQFIRSCKKWKNFEQNQGGKKYPANSKQLNVSWIGRNLCRDCLLEHVMKGNMEWRVEVTGRRRRRRKHLLHDLKRKTEYCKLIEKALERPLWRTRFGWGYGPGVRQIVEWMENLLFANTKFIERPTRALWF